MESILSRIEQIAINEGITLTALEKQIGASKAVLTRALNNNTDISTKWIKKIVDIYQRYNIEWIITGNGEMYKYSEYKNNPFKTDANSVNNTKDKYKVGSMVDRLLKLAESQQEAINSQQRTIEKQNDQISSLIKKKGGTNNNGNNASSA